MFSRQDMLEISGMKVPAYDALASRGLLPFKTVGGQFGEKHLLKLGMFRALAGSGVSQAVAARTVDRGFDDFDSFVADAKASPKAVFLFGISAMETGPDVDWHPIFAVWQPGRPMKLAATRGQALDSQPPARMVLIDATKVVSEVLEAARRVGRSGRELEAWAVHFHAKVKR
jgi:hypothetical protein